MNKSGIYAIHCNINNKYYIGKSVDMNHRKNQHFQALNRNCHNNKDLQFDYNKYGKDNFSFIELVTCPEDMLNHMEHYWIKKYDSINNGYNIINATTNLNLYKSTTNDINFIELEDEYYKFFDRYLKDKIVTNDENKISLHKIKILLELLLNDDIDIKFIIECLYYNKINLYCMIDSTNPLYDIDCGLDKYEMEINNDIAIDIFEKTDIYIKLSLKFTKEEVDKIQYHNKCLRENINELEQESIKVKNEILKIAVNFLEFYENKTFKDINDTITNKNKLYDKLNKINNKLNEIEKNIL